VSITGADQGGAPVMSIAALAARPLGREQLSAVRAGAVAAESLFDLVWTRVTGRSDAEPAAAVVVGADSLGLGPVLGAPVVDSLDQAAGHTAHLLVLPCIGPDMGTGSPHAAQDAVASVLATVRAWSADQRFADTRVLILTRGAVATREGEDVSDLAAAAVWGAVRAVQAELPGQLVIADIERPQDILTVLGALGSATADDQTADDQFAARDAYLLAPRLTRLAPGAPAAAPVWDPDGTVVITGGTGTLGSLIAEHLVHAHGVRHLLLLSRRGPDTPHAGRLRSRLAALGAAVTVTACDTADPAALAQALGTAGAEHPVTTIVHTAAALHDATLTTLTPAQLIATLTPKTHTAWHLHRYTLDRPGIRLILFSAAGGILGSAGQAAYSAANAYLDALAAHRRARGLPAVSLAWGLWQETSAMTGHLNEADRIRLHRAGVLPMSTPDALTLFDQALTRNRPLAIAVRLDYQAFAADEVRPVLRALTRQPSPPRAGASPAARPAFSVAGLTPGERAYAIRDLVLRTAALVLGHTSPDILDPDRGFLSAGFDSLRGVELRNRLNTATGLRLPATLIFDHPSPTALADHLDTLLPRPVTPAPDLEPTPPEPDEFADASLEDLLEIVDTELRNS
jgi:hypothetical protein